MEHILIDRPAAGPLIERVGLALNSTLDLREVLRALAEAVLAETAARRVSLFLWRGGILRPAVALGTARDEDLWEAFRELGPVTPTKVQATILAEGRAVVIPDPATSALVPRGWVERFHLSGVVIVPLHAAGEPCGLMAVDYPDSDAAINEDVGLLEAIGSYAGVAVRNARLYAAAERRARLGETLARAATAMAPPMPPKAVAGRLAAAFTDLLEPAWCAVTAIDGDLIRPLITIGAPLPTEPIPFDDVPEALRDRVHDAWRSGAGQPCVVERDPWLARLASGTDRHLIVPLPTGARPVGLVIAGFGERSDLDAQALDAASTLAALGGAALERHGLLSERERQLRQLDLLFELSTALTERADARVLVTRLNELLAAEGVEVVGVAFRDRRLARHFGGDEPSADERAGWRDNGGSRQLPDGTWMVPMRVGRRVVGSLRVRRPVGDPRLEGFLELVAAGAGELLVRGGLRASLEEATREQALAAERQRIADDMHGTIGRLLTSVGQLGRRLVDGLPDGAQLHDPAGQIVRLADGGKVQLDEAIRALAFVPGPRRGLVPSLRGLCRQLEVDSGVAVILEVNGRAARLPGRVEQTLYRVAFEVLVNAWRHARCTVIRLELSFTPSRVVLRVTDDGTGLGARETDSSPGLGLMGIRRVISDLGGQVEFANAEPHGLLMKIEVPRTGRSAA